MSGGNNAQRVFAMAAAVIANVIAQHKWGDFIYQMVCAGLAAAIGFIVQGLLRIFWNKYIKK